MTYKLYRAGVNQVEPNAAMTIGIEPQVSFIFDPANTDYQAFLKYQAEGGKVYGADEEVHNGQASEPADE